MTFRQLCACVSGAGRMGEATRENISQRKQQATQKKSHPHTHTQFRTHSKEIKIYDTDSKDVRKNHQPFGVCVCVYTTAAKCGMCRCRRWCVGPSAEQQPDAAGNDQRKSNSMREGGKKYYSCETRNKQRTNNRDSLAISYVYVWDVVIYRVFDNLIQRTMYGSTIYYSQIIYFTLL